LIKKKHGWSVVAVLRSTSGKFREKGGLKPQVKEEGVDKAMRL
jgi:hypothetical protein